MADLQELTDATFDEFIKAADKPVLIDFWAPWCGPCRMVAPIVASIAGRYADKIHVVKVNVDDAGAAATKLGIRSIPTLMVFNGGEVVQQAIGVQPEDALAAMVDKALAG